ncbi:MAG TPA: hypothetical protein DIU00_09740 [Phycisphaerales bacterium]|nr:hypothetical protein [Phycisphaerales bacterium]
MTVRNKHIQLVEGQRKEKNMYRTCFSAIIIKLFFPVLFFGLLVTSAEGDVMSTFDTDADGWVFGVDHSWQSTGGNPGGYILNSADDTTGFVSAPSKFLGDWAAMVATNLTYEIKIFDTGSVYKIGNYWVRIDGPGGNAYWLGPPAPPDPSAWLTLNVPITESDWTIESGSWNALLADVTQLRIATEFYNNYWPQEITGFDNVSLDINPTPVPSAVLLGMIGLSVAGVKLRKHA